MLRTYRKWISVWAAVWRIALLLVVLVAGLTVREQPAAADETVRLPADCS